MFNADGKPDVTGCHARCRLFAFIQLTMGGGGGMDRQAARITNIGHMVEHFQRLNKALPGFLAALEFNPNQTAMPAAQISICPAAAFAFHERWMDHPRHRRMLRQEGGGARCIGAMAFHAKRQGFHPLQEQEGIHRRHGRAQIAQQAGAHADDVGNRAKRFYRLGPDRAVIGRIRLVQCGEAIPMRFPIEITAIHHHTANAVAMPANPFGGGMHDNRGTMFQRAADDWRRGIVHDQGNAELPANGRHFRNRENLQLRVGKRLGIIGARALIGRTRETFRIGGVHEAHFNAELLQRIGEKIPGAAVKIGGGNNIVPRFA